MLLRYFFFFNDTATTEIYTLSLHDALPILRAHRRFSISALSARCSRRAPASRLLSLPEPRLDARQDLPPSPRVDRKSTRLNSSHANISYAVFCLKKKKTTMHPPTIL